MAPEFGDSPRGDEEELPSWHDVVSTPPAADTLKGQEAPASLEQRTIKEKLLDLLHEVASRFHGQ